MKLIPLTQGLFAMVDDKDYDELMKYRWHARKDRKQWYAARSSGAYTIYMHTHITGFAMTDHIDGNGLNNCRANLRETNRSLNALNTVKAPGKGSRFIGVYRHKRSGMWEARCSRHPEIDAGRKGKLVYLGQFDSEVDAAHTRDNAMRLRFGIEGVRNFPRAGERHAVGGQIAEVHAPPPRDSVQRVLRRGSSRFKGVSRVTIVGVWKAQCMKVEAVDGKSGGCLFLGHFASEEEAARAVDEATWVRHGKSGYYNLPRPGCRSVITKELWPE